MRSTIAYSDLSLTSLLERGRDVFGDSTVWCAEDGGLRSFTFAQVADEAGRLAGGLRELGVQPGDRVATMCWNGREHLAAYMAVPAMGAILHTVNMRLSPEDLIYILDQGGAGVLIADARLIPKVAEIRARLTQLRTVVVVGASDEPLPADMVAWPDLLAAAPAGEPWIRVDETSASVVCYTSGTTGLPKGVVYSHRSVLLHTLAISGGNAYGISARDRILTLVPMFHANAWGLPHAGWYAGAGLILPGRDLTGPALASLIRATAPTISAGVPTIWDDLMNHGQLTREDTASIRLLVGGGSAMPARLISKYRDELGVRMIQGWGLTESSPLAAIGEPVAEQPDLDDARMTAAGRVVAGVELRIVSDDDQTMTAGTGNIEIRGPWVTERYLNDDASEKFHDGWLRTGDIGTVDHGFVTISDRAKDLIKSGGEWIVPATLEEALRSNAAVREVAVVAIPHARWRERPAAWVVADGATADNIDQIISDRLEVLIPRWWMPDLWILTNALPRTSVGKIDKRMLRAIASELAEKRPGRVLRHDL